MRYFPLMPILGLGLCLSSGTAALANDEPLPKVFSDVLACRGLGDAQQRLACFDATVAALETANESKAVVVMSEESVKETRRGLFGFSFPRLGLFRDSDDDESVNEIASTVASFSGGTGRWVITLADGAVWEQVDGAYIKKPQIGQTILIKRAALGSYMGRIESGTTFRIKRRS